MINHNEVLAIIPARGGSKAIPKKNIAYLGGKPLINWTIEMAINYSEINRVIVSTDSYEIASVATKSGADVMMRPQELSTDDSKVMDTVRHIIEKIREEGKYYKYLILLEPTAPFRRIEDIKKCLKLIRENDLDTVATYVEAELNPHRAWKINGNTPELFIEGSNPWLPRQSLPKAYQLNGAVYVVRTELIENNPDINGFIFGKTGSIIMSKEDSVDIDQPIDLIIAESIIRSKKRSN